MGGGRSFGFSNNTNIAYEVGLSIVTGNESQLTLEKVKFCFKATSEELAIGGNLIKM